MKVKISIFVVLSGCALLPAMASQDELDRGSHPLRQLQPMPMEVDPVPTSTVSLQAQLNAALMVGMAYRLSTVIYDGQGRQHPLMLVWTSMGNRQWSLRPVCPEASSLVKNAPSGEPFLVVVTFNEDGTPDLFDGDFVMPVLSVTWPGGGIQTIILQMGESGSAGGVCLGNQTRILSWQQNGRAVRSAL